VNLAELFASVGYKVDEASIARFDAALEKTKTKTEGVVKANDALLDRMRAVAAAQDREAANNSEFLRLYDRLIAKKIDAAKAIGAVSLDPARVAAEQEARTARSWSTTVMGIQVGFDLLSRGASFVRQKINGLIGGLAEAGGRAGAIMDMSERTGIATDMLQELGYAAEQNGGNLQDVASGLRTLSSKADSAAAGSKSAAKALRTVGISARELRSGKTSLDEALGKIADKFASMADGPKKAALAMDLLGGAGVKLIPMLNKGSAGLAQTREEARRLGLVLSRESLSGLDKLDDDTAKLKTTMNGLRTQALAAIVPAFQKLVDKAQKWFEANRVQFVRALTAAFSGLVTILSVVADVVGYAVDAFAFFSEHAEIVQFAVTALTGALVAYKISTIAVTKASIAAAIASAAAWVAAAWPFIAIGLAIAAVIRYWPKIKAGAVAAARAIASAFKAVWSGIKTAFHAVIDGIKATFEAVVSWFSAKIDWVVGKWRSIKNLIVGDGGGQVAQGTRAIVQSSAQPPPKSTTIIHSNSPIEINSTAPAADVGKAARREFEAMWRQKLQQGGSR
jgi:hypothetical protein